MEKDTVFLQENQNGITITPLRVKFRKVLPDAQAPKRAREGDACFDLTAASMTAVWEDSDLLFLEYGTGLAMEIPEGYVGLVFPRSSVTNMNLMQKNSVGVIDSGYRGEIKVRFHNLTTLGFINRRYEIGDRVCQIMIQKLPEVEFEECMELSNSQRGEGGYGHTGR
jgi:dUTP pyrophosphatase